MKKLQSSLIDATIQRNLWVKEDSPLWNENSKMKTKTSNVELREKCHFKKVFKF